MRAEWINLFSAFYMDWRRCGWEGFQSSWAPGVTFTKTLTSAMPGGKCGLEG